MSKCGWVILEEDTTRWSFERLVDEKTSTSLRITLSGSAKEEKEDAAAVESPIQLFVPFAHWLSAALVYSQSFLEEPSTTMRRWERTFTSYVTDLYLRLQFEDDACSLLKAWLSCWVSSNIVRGQEELRLLALLPSQVALFRRLGLTPYRSSFPRVKDRVSTPIWQLVFVAINLAVDHNSTENPASLDQATELVVSTLTTLELVELSASSDFVHFSHTQEVEPFFSELEQFLSRPQLRACSAAQVFCLLQYPLELLVCCYACKIPADFEAESQLFLQRVKEVLHENFVGEFEDGTTELSIHEAYTGPSSSSVVDSAEMDVFLKYWADEMLLKYDYIDRERCGSVLVVIQAALQGEGVTSMQVTPV
ncbi:hypothetical protein PR003_g369 [Phytophthora rubi]|uniref:Uncharacterized protein n=1 Tax=Phytophthora rubi TaxID=129364 RepID=A0A6A4FYG6_9STRA|nr:hypothetical protein PR003_g369 [Phytophthora rubi]